MYAQNAVASLLRIIYKSSKSKKRHMYAQNAVASLLRIINKSSKSKKDMVMYFFSLLGCYSQI